jgi:hypothetical protein
MFPETKTHTETTRVIGRTRPKKGREQNRIGVENDKTIMASFCHVAGYFTIGRRVRYAFYTRTPTPNSDPADNTMLPLFAHYDCAVTGKTGATTPAEIRSAQPIRNDVHTPGTVVFVLGNIYVRTGGIPSIIDAVHMYALPGDPETASYSLSVPKTTTTHFSANGRTCTTTEMSDDGTKSFVLSVSQYVRQSTKTFRILSVTFHHQK